MWEKGFQPMPFYGCLPVGVVPRLPLQRVLMRYKIKSWHDYQHYKDRCPPWIKLHHSLLTSKTWIMGTDASRTLAISCMLLAARDNANDGSFDGDPEFVKRFAYLNSKPDFKQLIEYGFIELLQDASNALAKCDTETEAYTTTETEKRGAAFALPDWVNQSDWDLWIKTRKGKKMIPEQMQAQVEKLDAMRSKGLDHAQALRDAAANGWQGLFEPKQPIKTKADQHAITLAGLTGQGKNNEPIDITPSRRLG